MFRPISNLSDNPSLAYRSSPSAAGKMQSEEKIYPVIPKETLTGLKRTFTGREIALIEVGTALTTVAVMAAGFTYAPEQTQYWLTTAANAILDPLAYSISYLANTYGSKAMEGWSALALATVLLVGIGYKAAVPQKFKDLPPKR